MAEDPRQVFGPDPLRALLADEDRAVEMIAAYTLAADERVQYWAIRAVLAALREVAGL